MGSITFDSALVKDIKYVAVLLFLAIELCLGIVNSCLHRDSFDHFCLFIEGCMDFLLELQPTLIPSIPIFSGPCQ